MRNPRTQSPGPARGRDRQSYSLGTPIVLLCRSRIAVWALLAICLVFGCAQQYHWYRCGCDCVNYNYCAPAPLPYAPYCTCPTPIADQYSRQEAEAGSETTAPVTAAEASHIESRPNDE